MFSICFGTFLIIENEDFMGKYLFVCLFVCFPMSFSTRRNLGRNVKFSDFLHGEKKESFLVTYNISKLSMQIDVLKPILKTIDYFPPKYIFIETQNLFFHLKKEVTNSEKKNI